MRRMRPETVVGLLAFVAVACTPTGRPAALPTGGPLVLSGAQGGAGNGNANGNGNGNANGNSNGNANGNANGNSNGNGSGDDDGGGCAYALTTFATGVSTLSGGEALAYDAASGELYVKSLQDALGQPIEISRVGPTGSLDGSASVTMQNSDDSGIVVDPLSPGRLIIERENYANPGSTILSMDPTTMSASTVLNIPWTTNPHSNGSGQEQYAADPSNPSLLYFWDGTTSALYRLDRSTGALAQLLALDSGVANGLHSTTHMNDLALDAASGTILIADGASRSVLEVDPSTTPATTTTLFSGLADAPNAIALDPDGGVVYVVVGFQSLAVGPRHGGTLTTIASGFTSLADVVAGPAGSTCGRTMFAVDKSTDTVFQVTASPSDDD